MTVLHKNKTFSRLSRYQQRAPIMRCGVAPGGKSAMSCKQQTARMINKVSLVWVIYCNGGLFFTADAVTGTTTRAIAQGPELKGAPRDC